MEQESQDKSSGFVGTLKQIHLVDLIQMCCQSAMSMVIRVINQAEHGIVVIDQGEIIHAVCGDQVGDDAFFTILGWKKGEFETIGEVHVPEPTVHQNSQYLLMEAARIADEHELEDDAETETQPQVPQESGDSRKVLIVDDSKMMCRVLSDIIEKEPCLTVAGTAANGQDALDLIHTLKPDLITLDVNMPVMGGETALKHIMIQSPCPVAMISSVGGDAPSKILDFLKLGAVDFIPKPGKTGRDLSGEERMLKRIKQAANGQSDRFKRLKFKDLRQERLPLRGPQEKSESLIVVCSGGGGYMEMIDLFSRFPTDLKASVLWIQTMPGNLCAPLANFADTHSHIPVQAVKDNTILIKGRGYVASFDDELTFDCETMTLSVQNEGQAKDMEDFMVNLARVMNGSLLLLLLSGSECDDFEGLKAIIDHKANVLFQNPATCVVPGFLEKASEKHLAEVTQGTQDMIRRIISWADH